jgi:hypothetical protein
MINSNVNPDNSKNEHFVVFQQDAYERKFISIYKKKKKTMSTHNYFI